MRRLVAKLFLKIKRTKSVFLNLLLPWLVFFLIKYIECERVLPDSDLWRKDQLHAQKFVARRHSRENNRVMLIKL